MRRLSFEGSGNRSRTPGFRILFPLLPLWLPGILCGILEYIVSKSRASKKCVFESDRGNRVVFVSFFEPFQWVQSLADAPAILPATCVACTKSSPPNQTAKGASRGGACISEGVRRRGQGSRRRVDILSYRHWLFLTGEAEGTGLALLQWEAKREI